MKEKIQFKNFYETEYYKEIEESAPMEMKIVFKKELRTKLLLRLLEKNKQFEICDVGCGPAFYAKYFYDLGFNIRACDISKKIIKWAEKKNPGPRYFVWDIEKRKLNKKFNLIYSFDVIEHIFDYDSFLENIRNSLKDNGLLLLSTPNILAPRNRINILLGNGSWFKGKEHIRFFSPKILEEALRKNKFKIIKFIGTGKLSWLSKNLSGSIHFIAKK